VLTAVPRHFTYWTCFKDWFACMHAERMSKSED